MQSRSPGFSLSAYTGIESMAGVIDCGLGIDAKTSPRHAELDKAQAKLQQEFDKREERRRELEFLENGGNPLDFKISHASSISLQSTSLTDQVAEPCFTSEAKNSFTLAASPHGDSVESSGRPGGSVGREPNIGDNLLLLDGDSKLSGDRHTKLRGKRGSTALSEQSSQVDGCHNVKETDVSVILRLGAKSQAYARRNRSRTSRDCANLGLTDSGSRNGNKVSTTSSFVPSLQATRGSLSGLQTEECAASSISNSKAASEDGIIILKSSARDGQADKQLDVVQSNDTCADMMIDGQPGGGKEVKITENLQGTGPCRQDTSIAEKAPHGTSSQASDILERDNASSVGLLSGHLESNESKNDICSAENIDGFGAPDQTITFLDDDPCHKISCADDNAKNLSADITERNTCVNGTHNIQENMNCDQSLMVRTIGSSDGNLNDQGTHKGVLTILDCRPLKENYDQINCDAPDNANDSSQSIESNNKLSESIIEKQGEVTPVIIPDLVKPNGEIICVPEKKIANSHDSEIKIDNFCVKKSGMVTSLLVSSASDFPKDVLLHRSSASISQLQTSVEDQKRTHEDAILKEAKIIEARLKRARELPACNKISQKQQKCHWDFVLEEMAWMANDFMQERLWKIAAAARVSQCIASHGRSKFDQVNLCRKQKNLSRSLVKAVQRFWHEAEAIHSGHVLPNSFHLKCKSHELSSSDINGTQVEGDQDQHTVLDYAVRLIKYNSSASYHSALAEAPSTPDIQNDVGILVFSWDDQLSEENLFYTVPPGAMQSYRESIESHWLQNTKIGNNMHQDDYETSMCNSMAGVSCENVYEEDEGETCTYLLPGTFEGGLLSKLSNKKRKYVQEKFKGPRVSEFDTDLYEPGMESKAENQSFINGKRTSSAFGVGSIPKKRARTATRQRIVSHPSGVIGSIHKTDVSSEDTSSLQDDQNSLHGGGSKKNLYVESTMDFDRQLPYDGNEISSKLKKKKQHKHLGYNSSANLVDPGPSIFPGRRSSYEQRLQVDHLIQHEQKEHVKRRMDYQSFDSTVVHGQHILRKPKVLKQLPEASSEGLNPVTGSLPSPVASQMSNMSNSNKLIRFVTNRDRARKSKAQKIVAGYSGSGNSWSNFEDQALVVLVHDMGPNWELVSDAINSTLQFKCIFRKPKECKLRHKSLMEKSTGDGADSAEDSGSSQPYPSTLPGIPKGSARQLFQRLQGPMEEDILKTHFEKIILLGQRISTYSHQNDNQEPKQITPAHNSHVAALSQVCPNNLSGVVFTPLDFGESISSSSDVYPLGYQGSHAANLAGPGHQGSLPPILPTSGVSTMLQGPSGTVLTSSLPSVSAPLNPSPRDTQRYGVPRPSGLPVDDPQRMQQFSQMLPGRNFHQSSMPLPGALPAGHDHVARMLPGATGLGNMSGMNCGMSMSRPPFQGTSSPSMLNMVSTGSMLSSSGHGVQSSLNVHPSSVSSQGNSMMRLQDPLLMLRPGQNAEEHRQMMMQELQMKGSQTTGRPAPPFSAMNPSFSNATVPAPIQTFTVQQHQQSHQMAQQPPAHGNPHHLHMQGTSHSHPQQQVYAMRGVKERQLQHRIMPQSQHISGPNRPPLQNNSQIQPQSQSCPPATPVSSTQSQNKQQNLPRNPPSGMPNQILKQRQQQQQRQQVQQQHHRQQSQQQVKHVKGLGRGNILVHHNLSADASQVSGFTTASKSLVTDKHPGQQGQGFFPDSSDLNPTSHQPGSQANINPHPLSQQTKQVSTISDTCNQGSAQSSQNHSMLVPQQSSLSLPKQHKQPPQRYLNHSQQSIQRIVLQQNHRMKSDGRLQQSTDPSQINQIIPGTSIPQGPDADTASASVVSSSTLWNPETLCDANAATPMAHIASSAQENVTVSEALVPSCSQGLVSQQQSASVSVHGHNTVRQWQQQQQQQPQPQQDMKNSKYQNQQMVQSDLHAQKMSNSGAG